MVCEHQGPGLRIEEPQLGPAQGSRDPGTFQEKEIKSDAAPQAGKGIQRGLWTSCRAQNARPQMPHLDETWVRQRPFEPPPPPSSPPSLDGIWELLYYNLRPNRGPTGCESY